MKPTLWAEVKRVFADSLDVAAERREEFVRSQCGDERVRDEALRLLRRREQVTGFLRPPIVLPFAGPAGRERAETALRPHSESAGPEGRAATSTGVVDGAGAATASVQLAAGAVLAGRYELGRRLGAGAFGAVHRAKDRLTGQDVAVKVLPLAGAADQQAMRHEVAVLRRARLPGVVELLDDGVELGHAFLVMRLVDGLAFPGAAPEGPLSWDALAPRALALVEALGRLHWLGVLHRDIKPDNVLVEEDGAVTIVDLGVARDLEGLPDLSGAYLVGTPAYLAPERLEGAPASVASDLYAVGAMLWEALAGRPLRDARDFDDLVRRRAEPAPPLGDVAPSVPVHVAHVVDEMLRPDPARRPRSARVAAALLRGEGESGARVRLPFVGSDAAVVAVVEAVRARRPIDVVGPPGSGRTRTLEEAARRLEAEGRRVVFVREGNAPFESLASVLGPPSDGPGPSLDEMHERLQGLLGAWLGAGVGLFANGWDDLDRESQRTLAAVQSTGALVRAVAPSPPGAIVAGTSVVTSVAPSARAEADLRALFHGPDRILHLREDAARQLYRRTRGVPGPVVREIEAWIEGGVARWEDGLCRIGRDGIERLETEIRTGPLPRSGAPAPDLPGGARAVLAWLDLAGAPLAPSVVAAAMDAARWEVDAAASLLEAHGLARCTDDGAIEATVSLGDADDWSAKRRAVVHSRIAAALPRAADLRFHHLALADQADEMHDEVLELAERHRREGRAARAVAVLTTYLGMVRRGAAWPGDLSEPVGLLVDSALAAGSIGALQAALGEIGSLPRATGPAAHHEEICRAALQALRGDARRAIDSLRALPAGLGARAARQRHVVATLAARFVPDVAEERRAVTEAAVWARSRSDPQALALLAEFLGWLRYREGRFDRAWRLHRAAAARRREAHSRVSALLNAASAALEAQRPDVAREFASQALARAAVLRAPLHEARAEWTLRSARLRSGEPLATDRELIAALEIAGLPQAIAPALLVEAAAAWRGGRQRESAELAVRCFRAFEDAGRPWPAMLAAALAAAGGDPSADSASTVLERLPGCPHPRLKLQAAALVHISGAPPPGALRTLLRERWNSMRLRDLDQPLEVLSAREALAVLGTQPGCDPGQEEWCHSTS